MCKARDSECGKCKKTGHFTHCCNSEKWNKKKVKKLATGKVNVISTDTAVSETAAATAAVLPSSEVAGAPVAALNSVETVGRESLFSTETCDFWAVSNMPVKIQIKRLWSKMIEPSVTQPLGHYIYDNSSGVWNRSAPPNHAAKKVRVELDRSSYAGYTRTKARRRAIYGPAFPDSGAQVTLINPSLVNIMGGVT